MSTQMYQLQTDGTWKRPTAIVPPVGEWIYGPLTSYFPSPSTSGVPVGTDLVPYPATGGPFGSISATGQLALSGNGTLVYGWDFQCGLNVTGQNITIQDCLIRGKLGAPVNPLVICYGPNVRNLTVQDCTIKPDYPGRGTDGITGHHYTAKRNKMINCCDSFGIFNTYDTSSPVLVNIFANYATDHAYFSPDPAHPNDPGISHTHNDGIQIQSGNGIRILGNTMLGFIDPAIGQANFSAGLTDPSSTPPGGYNTTWPVMVGNAALQVTQGVGAVYDVWYNNNYVDGGTSSLNIYAGVAPAQTTGWQIKDNQFGRGQYLQGAGGDDTYTILTTGLVGEVTGNVYADNGHAVRWRNL